MSLCLNSKICAFLATTMFFCRCNRRKKPFEPIRETDGIALFSAKKMDAANICRTGQKAEQLQLLKAFKRSQHFISRRKGRSLASFQQT